jgi:hypothetical protein
VSCRRAAVARRLRDRVAREWAASAPEAEPFAYLSPIAEPVGVVPDAVTVTPELPAIVSVDQRTASTFRARFCRASRRPVAPR